MKKLLLFILFYSPLFSGVDIPSKIEKLWLSKDKLWLKMENKEFNKYCTENWNEFNLYIPKSHEDYAYYYGLISSAFMNQKTLYIANISTFNGTSACNITQTGYGIVIQH